MRALSLLLLGVTASAGAAPPKMPSRLQALRLLQTAVPGARSVSDVLADLGDGRFPVLFVVRGSDCLERVIDGQKEKSCSPTSSPHVAVLRHGDDGQLVVQKDLALPTEAPPWDKVQELSWGITFVKDDDGDGQPELLVAYGYDGPMAWAVGDVFYKHLVIVNLDALTVAFAALVERAPQAGTGIHGTWTLEPNGTGFDIVLQTTRRSGKDGQVEESSERWVHGAGDLWHRRD